MSQITALPPPPPTAPIFYPDSDGKPMAENTEQFRWISTLKGGFDFMYVDESDVFVAGDLLTDEAIIWHILVKRPHDVIAVLPGKRTDGVVVVSGRLGKTDEVEPQPAP